MTFAKKAALGIAAMGGALLLASFFLPRTARVERSIVVEAPQATVFTVLNGFGQFDKWSPWADLDPDAKTTHEGPQFGVGAKMSWAGNDAVGTGSQEIVESTPYSAIKLRLGFGDAPGDFTSTYALQPAQGGTQVTWALDADYGGSTIGRWFGLLTEHMVGPDYEEGLRRLKALVEAMPRGDFSSLRFEPVDVAAIPAVMVPVRSADEPVAIGLALGVAYGRLFGYMNVHGLEQAGPSVAIYRGKEGGTLTIDAAVPVERAPDSVSGVVRVVQLPGGPSVRAEYRGAQAGLPAARAQLEAYLAAAGLERAGPIWEQYVGDPKAPEAERVTHIYCPIKRAAS